MKMNQIALNGVILTALAFFGLPLIPASIAVAAPSLVPPKWKASAASVEPSSNALRAYGRVSLSSQKLTSPDGKTSVTLIRFVTERESNAALLLAKCFSDLTLSHGVKDGSIDIGGRAYRLVTVDGGSVYSGAIIGASAYLVAGSSPKVVQQFIVGSPLLSSPIARTEFTKYPAYLDRFDRYGWGFYGLGGVGVDQKWKDLPGASRDADPTEDLDFLAKHKFRFEPWLDTAAFDNAQGLPYEPEASWMMEQANKRNLPFSVRLYGNLPHSWEFGDAFEKPADFLETGWYNGSWQFRTLPHQSWYNERGRRFLAWQAQQQTKKFNEQPNLQGWMLPIGEIGPDKWYGLNGDFSEAATQNWRAHLRANGVSLETLSRLYSRENNAFASWDQVPVPEFADFVGLSGMTKDLAGDWYVRKADAAKADGWWKADVQTAGWDVLRKPGSETWFNQDSERGFPKWCVREFDLPAKNIVAGKPLYLYLYLRYSDSGRTQLHTPVYVNGEKAGDVGRWGAIEVSKLIKAGANRVAIETDTFGGRAFLSWEKPAIYPYLGADRNKLWLLFRNWQLDGPYKLSETVLAGMRQADPNRPIKMMAPIGMGTDRWLDLANRFGAFGHFTGEGTWYFPWYKRYGYLYGVPATSEGGGPSRDVAKQQNLFQRIFLAGLDGHDQVFLAQDVTRRPELKAWYENHIATLKQLGRYDISGPQVLIYRSTAVQQYNMEEPYPSVRESNDEVQDAWNWDIGRGTLQTIGQSYLYVDDGGIKDGKLGGYEVLMDGGNETTSEEALSGIEEWVRGGGTYITWPFTGRSTLLQPNSWPISRLTGCTIKKLRKPGTGTVSISQNQPYFKELAGRTFPDAGNCVDWQKSERNQLSVELSPGPDSEVIAKFENGSPAIVVRKLGAGRVIVLGSAFFRDAKDIDGIWWAGEREATFFRDLLTNLGQPAVNVTSDPKVWAQRYRMKNGLDEVVTLVNFADGPRDFTLTTTVERKPTRVYQVAGNTMTEVPFTMNGTTVTLKPLHIPHKEVQLYLFRASDSEDAAKHWWAQQQRAWQPTEKMPLDLSDVGRGRWGGNAIELMDGWRLSQNVDEKWFAPQTDDTNWKEASLGILNFQGVDPDKLMYLRKRFDVPSHWLSSGGATKLVQGAFTGMVYSGSWNAGSQIYLNGQLIQNWGQGQYLEIDVSRHLKEKDNVIGLVIRRGDSKFIGALGATYLTYSESPTQRLPLKWQVTDSTGKSFIIPGKAPKNSYAHSKKIFIPAEWKAKYHVVFSMSGERTSIAGVMLNDKMVRRFHHWFGGNAEIDLTRYLRFGQDNLIAPVRAGDVEWDLSSIELRLYPRDEK